MFSYLDGFDHICANVTPMEVVNLVNKMFLTFDKLSEKHDVYKVGRFEQIWQMFAVFETLSHI